jgi:quercetin 2,3-dioxygenase
MQSTTRETTLKPLRRIGRTREAHWVGDGFPVRTLFDYVNHAIEMSPFLLLDYGGPMRFEPTERRLGVGQHPHRGFETVTIVYEGEVEHRDSTGGGGRIGPGDVQWMTAAGGIVHEEFHGREFARRGGNFEMIQLWVNLPAKDKMSQPRYQAILASEIPVVNLPEGAGEAHIIAGAFGTSQGPASTFTPIQVWNLRLNAGRKSELAFPDADTTALVILSGEVRVNDSESIRSAEIGVFDRSGERVELEALQDSRALLLSGEPIQEPVVGQGPFVMNTEDEIREAIADFRSGRMGRLSE